MYTELDDTSKKISNVLFILRQKTHVLEKYQTQNQNKL